MRNSTTIKHDLRIAMGLNLLEYCIADRMYKYPKASVKKIGEVLHVDPDKVQEIMQRLYQKGILTMDTETNKLQVSDNWIKMNQEKPRKVAVVKKGPEDYALTHRIKLATIEMRPLYAWRAVDAKHALDLSKKLSETLKYFRRDPTFIPSDNDILDAFIRFVQKLPETQKWSSWDLGTLNSCYNKILSELENLPNKGKDNIKVIVESVTSRQEKTGFKIQKDY